MAAWLTVRGENNPAAFDHRGAQNLAFVDGPGRLGELRRRLGSPVGALHGALVS